MRQNERVSMARIVIQPDQGEFSNDVIKSLRAAFEEAYGQKFEDRGADFWNTNVHQVVYIIEPTAVQCVYGVQAWRVKESFEEYVEEPTSFLERALTKEDGTTALIETVVNVSRIPPAFLSQPGDVPASAKRVYAWHWKSRTGSYRLTLQEINDDHAHVILSQSLRRVVSLVHHLRKLRDRCQKMASQLSEEGLRG